MRKQKVKILGVAAGVLLLGSAGVYAASAINNEPSKAVSEQNSTKKLNLVVIAVLAVLTVL